jgi:hypothetical protein
MGGECVPALPCTTAGVAGDRRYALRDPDGRLGSGKAGGRFARIDGLLGFGARHEGERVVVRFPDGREVAADAADIDEQLRAELGQSITLVEARPGIHVDAAPLHLLTTASLRWLRSALPGAAADERRFRPNVVIEAPGDQPVEQDWIGARLAVGSEVILRITEPTERCGMVALAQQELPRDPAVLRCITRAADLCFGVYAEVIAGGTIHPGGEVRLVAGA